MRSLFIVFILTSFTAFSQQKDAMLWTGASLKAKLIKDLSAKYETQTRFYQNASSLYQYYNEFGLDYEIIKNLEFGTTYRYSRKKRDFSYYTGENRLSFDLGYDFDLFKTGIELKGRGRYQWSFDRVGVINDVIYPDIKHTFRFKFEAKYKNDNIKRFEPYVSYEFYNAIQPINPISKLDTYRLSVGLDIDLPAKNEISIFYIFENENRSVINQNHIYGIQYSYSLGKLIDSKDKNDTKY